MPDQEPQNQGIIGRFLALPADSVPKTIFVAVALCLVASMVVSAVAVSLRPVQEVPRHRVQFHQVRFLHRVRQLLRWVQQG